MQKLLVGILVLSIFGAAGVGIYDALKPAEPVESLLAGTSADGAVADEVSTPVGVVETAAIVAEATAGTMPVEAAQGNIAANINQLQLVGAESIGDPWSVSAVITELTEVGMNVALADGTNAFVELGPTTFWSTQGATINVGDTVAIEGFANGEQYHARVVTAADGTQIVLRTEDGQPMWSGGATNAGGGASNEAHDPTQMEAVEWITIFGEINRVTNGNTTIMTTDGELMNLQLGQPSFWQSQGVTFVTGEYVKIVGFWQGSQFQAGEIQSVTTGQRVMLLDPNGRPLWAGPGRNGNSSQANEIHPQTDTTTAAVAPNTTAAMAAVSEQAAPALSNQVPDVIVPANQWIAITGNVSGVEPLDILVRLETGQTVSVDLGPVDFWTAQGYTFVMNEALTVEGFWLNGIFEAGRVTFGDGTGSLEIRDMFGYYYWSDAASSAPSDFTS